MLITELKIYLDLSLDSKPKVLDRYAKKFDLGYFFVDSEDGQCYLFDRCGNEQDVSWIHKISKNMIPKDIKKIVIPKNAISIDEYAFYVCSSLTSVTIPNSVMSIDCWAFYGCSSLTNVTIGNSVTSIGGWAFYGCSGLTNMIIPDNVTYIGYNVFYNCNNLKSLVFKNKTMKQVKAMYPFGIADESIIKAELS